MVTLFVLIYVVSSLIIAYWSRTEYREITDEYIEVRNLRESLIYGFTRIPLWVGYLAICVLIVIAFFASIAGIIYGCKWIIENLP